MDSQTPGTPQPSSNASMLDVDAVNRLLQQQPDEAAKLLQAAARAGHAPAQTWLAQLYLDGTGVSADAQEALHWFQRAAHADVPMAMNMLGRCHESGWGTPIDYELAAVWYRRAATHDLDWAVYNLAQMHANGRGMMQSRAEAFRWFTRAVELGHARAMHFLGQFYEYGWEVEVDQAHAFELYRRSAEGGDYRGLCSWASVLAGQGRIDEASSLIEGAIALAPRHYLEPLAQQLRSSSQIKLHALIKHINTRLRSTEYG
ncbi:tetratricopeptide repeat protein [Dyella silvatica]|uniref:tetratricopeptide repeat protein n=1 Tax=Dyella silvatica TaxID=2992128 RepID=UPI00225573B2|nr:tetratricopeptide repeat protein [Dyella silvatica]